MINENNNNFSRNIIKIYKVNPVSIKIIFDYNLVKGPINYDDENGNNLIHHIVLNNDISTLSSVLNHINYFNILSTGVINHQNNNGDTPMHLAVRQNNEEIAKLLDKAGANLSIKNSRGERISSSEEENRSLKSQSNNRSNNIWKNLLNSNDSLNLANLDDSSMSPNNYSVTSVFLGKNNDNTSDSDLIVQRLAQHLFNLRGGGKRSRSRSRSYSPSRTNESSEIHDKVLEILKTVMGSEEDARAIKLGLYGLVKKNDSNLSNLEKAKKMLEYLEDEKIMKGLKKRVSEFKEILITVRQNKEAQGKSINNELNKKPKEPKTKKSMLS